MPNETEDVDFNNEQVEEVVTNEGSQAESAEETKSQETEEAKYARLKRQTERLGKKLGIEPEKSSNSSKASELDYGMKAFLNSNGIKGTDETNLVREFMKETGKSLDDVLESRYFQAELAELRELRETSNAMPRSSKRTNQSSQDSVDYWITRGELPKDSDLRRKVVNERIRREKSVSVFGS